MYKSETLRLLGFLESHRNKTKSKQLMELWLNVNIVNLDKVK